jgi:hypothetical protein
MDRAQAVHREVASSSRSEADVSTLFVELGRCLRGLQFYPEGHPARRELLDRGLRAWRSELERGGPIDLEIRRGALWLAGTDVAVGRGRFDDLARSFVVRAVRRIRFDAALDAGSFGAFLEVLSTDPEVLREDGGFERALFRVPRQGVQVNEIDYGAALAGDRAEGEDTEPDVPVRGEIDEAPAAPSLPLGVALEANPLEAAPVESRGEDLLAVLRDLDAASDDSVYRTLAIQAVSIASDLARDGLLDEGYRALLVFASHAGDEGKRSWSQREAAQESLERLATEGSLGDLANRACAAGTEASLRATELLLMVGGRAAPTLIDQLAMEAEPERRKRLTSVLIAMGDETAPALADAVAHGGGRRSRVALRLAGETQNPRLVPELRQTLLEGEGEGVREAARALVRIGDVTALEALVDALHSPRSEVAGLAAYSLGTTGRALCLPPLAEALGRALRSDQLELAREVVRGIGRLGRPDGVPPLVGVLVRRGWRQRRSLRELKLAAIAGLAHLPGREAYEALTRAARARDAHLREAAARALRQREGAAPPR